MLYNEYLQNRFDYQEIGHLFLLERKHACLFYKPGKGKTYPCIDALRDVNASKKNAAKVLILSTADSVRRMWNTDIVPQNILPANTVIMSFTQAIQDLTKIKLKQVKWDVIIIDECHKIKSHNSQISKLVYALTKNAEYVWGLTGTPRGNSDIDIFCQFHNLRISQWGDISYTSFIENCCDRDEQFFRGHKVFIPKGIKKEYKAGWERNIAMYTQRIGYDENDDMPPIEVNEVNLPYVPTKEYLQAEEGVIAIPEYESTMTKLAAIQKLHQIVNGFIYISDIAEDDRKIFTIEHNKKLDWLKQNIPFGGKRVIVYRFAADLENIKSIFAPEYYTDDIDEFKTNKNKYILLLQCSRCESFNLQMCNHIVFYTLDYSFIKYNQMLHRVWRVGQTEKVHIDVLLFKDTVETKIWHTVQNKEKLADLFMHVKEA